MNSALFPTLTSRFVRPPRLYLQRAAAVEEPLVRYGRRYWVVPRSLCRFFKIPPLADASNDRQLDALRLQIERLSPFVESGSHFHFGANFINLWLWDAQVVSDAATAIGIDLRRVSVLPESALQPAGEGVRMIECLDGVEGQCWNQGSLVASRWWPTPPDSRNWVLFQRGAAVSPDRLTTNPPAAVALPWLPRPWTNSRTDGWGGISNIDLRLAAAGIAVALLIGYDYLGMEWLRLSWARSAVERQITVHSAEVAPTVEARIAALENAGVIQRLRRLDPYPSQLSLMARVADILPKNETHLTEWSYDRGQLEMTVAADHPLDAVFFVRALERVDGFKSVAVERAGGGDNSLRIRLTVEPQ
jgi:hypothetical protein